MFKNVAINVAMSVLFAYFKTVSIKYLKVTSNSPCFNMFVT